MSKENRPAFLFFASDWLTSTAFMDAESRGMYINLIAYQWVNGELPNDFSLLCRLAGIDSASSTATSKLQALIKQKFKQTASTCLINEKLERVREKAVVTASNLSERGRKGAAAKQANARKKQSISGDSEPLGALANDPKNSAYDSAKKVLGENEYKDRNEDEYKVETRGVQGGNREPRKSFAHHVEKFIEAYGGIKGTRREIEVAYIDAVNMLNGEGIADSAAHELLSIQAARDRDFCKMATQTRNNTANWLKKRLWEKNYDDELRIFKETQDSKTAKGGLKNGTSVTEQVIRFNNENGL